MRTLLRKGDPPNLNGTEYPPLPILSPSIPHIPQEHEEQQSFEVFAYFKLSKFFFEFTERATVLTAGNCLSVRSTCFLKRTPERVPFSSNFPFSQTDAFVPD
jgi:hypothetical protein